MKKICLGLLLLSMVSFASARQAASAAKPAAKDMSAQSAAAKPQTPPTLSKVLDNQFSGLERENVPAAEAMPEEQYNFAPTNGEFKTVRTFAQQVKHVAAVNYLLGAAILGEKPPVVLGSENGPDSITSKADIVKFLKDSCAYVHKALATINEGNATGLIDSPFGPGKMARLGAGIIATSHGFDHYGQMALYLRMNNIIPPASRPAPAK